MRLLLSLVTMMFLGTPAAAQVVGQNTQPGGSGAFTMAVSTKLVIEAVNVKDKQGKPLKGLTAKDFTVTENGVPQQISFCEYQELPTAPVTSSAKTTTENITVYNRLVATQIAPESPGTVRYKDRRLISLYFDLTAMPPDDKLRALEAAQKFIRTQMTSADLVSIMRYGGSSVDVLQDFTDDHDRLLSILETLIVGENQQSQDISDDAASSDTGAAFGQDSSEFNLFNTDRQLSALQTAAKMLGRLSEKKVLIYFASGLTLHGVDNQAQLHATIDDAVRSGVSFWPIDARGLVAQSPLGDASQGSPGNAGMYSGTAAQAVTTRMQQSQDTLYALAGDTGGKALLDYNDLTRGIVQAQQNVTSYYILGYYTSNETLDGRFRRIKITTSPELAASLDYRQGYYAGKVFGKFTTADKERQLEDALMLEDPVTELTIAMEINYFQLNRAEYFVPVVVKIPGRELALAKKGGAEHTLIDFVLEVKDELGNNTTVQNMRDNVNIKLSEATANELARRPVEYDTGFTLLPGKYTIKFLARDDETGRIGTFQTAFLIPNLNKEDKRVAISSVVLGGQRVDLKDAIYNAAKEKDRAKQDAANPLVLNGQKLIPSVTRVFSKSRDLYVYLQAYEQGAATAQPLIAFVSFYQGKTKVFETQPMEVASAMSNSLKIMPLRFGIGLNPLPPGNYDCQVTVLDPTGQKSAFWQAPITLVP
ncbi:MAG TPA: VWA domain-containing protein [Granulicella sp.]|jgi:VWFA-related protein|nr:VWA domain-containing protein [Granulicella sp.]